MPYQSTQKLPENVREALPSHAQEIYNEAYNSAWDQYNDSQDRREDQSREATAHQVAWSAVKQSYKKSDNGNWVKK